MMEVIIIMACLIMAVVTADSLELKRPDAKESGPITSEHSRQFLLGKPTCRVVYYLHIPKTGGTSTHQVIGREASSRPDLLHIPPNGVKNREDLYEHVFLPLQSRRYKYVIINAHHYSPPLITFLPHLLDLKRDVAGLGCDFYFFTELRNPLSRLKSSIAYNNIPQNEIFNYMDRTRSIQANYIIYNHPSGWPRAAMNNTDSKQKLYEILKYFNYVTPMEDPRGYAILADCVKFKSTQKPRENVTGKPKPTLTSEMIQYFETTWVLELEFYARYATEDDQAKQALVFCPPLVE
eukprot:m.123389 g.123389  ORF g.123389 m.123389 type:complete len:293 (+) comp15571_c0_seq1:273-1151(+)